MIEVVFYIDLLSAFQIKMLHFPARNFSFCFALPGKTITCCAQKSMSRRHYLFQTCGEVSDAGPRLMLAIAIRRLVVVENQLLLGSRLCE